MYVYMFIVGRISSFINFKLFFILSKFFFIHQLMHKWIVLKTILKFTLKLTLKQLRRVLVLQNSDMFRCYYHTIIREHINRAY